MIETPRNIVDPLGRVAAAAGAAAFVVGAGVVAYINPTESHILPVCPLYTLTGIACPGCGLTRAFHALFNGDWIVALDFNLLAPIWAVILAYVTVSLILMAVRGRGLPMWPTNSRFLWAFMAVLLIFGVLRNIPIWPLTILYP